MKGQTYVDPRKAAWKRASETTESKKTEFKSYFIPLSERGLSLVTKEQLAEKIAELDRFEAELTARENLAESLNAIVPGFVRTAHVSHFKITIERDRMTSAMESK